MRFEDINLAELALFVFLVCLGILALSASYSVLKEAQKECAVEIAE